MAEARSALPLKEMFAEMLAEGWTILEIREQMGLTETAAQNYMKQIRADLGVPGHD